MEELQVSNFVELRGVLSDAPVFSHVSRGISFCSFSLETERLSGAVDRINIIARQSQLEEVGLTGGSKVHITGQLRSFNNKSGVGSRLVITVFVQSIELDDGPDMNSVTLLGTLCKPPNFRTTPLGRDICDLMLAVNRHYGRSDYLPCIAWGSRARAASEWPVGTSVSLEGRIQSRKYIKASDSEAVEKTAFEVSVTDIFQVV